MTRTLLDRLYNSLSGGRLDARDQQIHTMRRAQEQLHVSQDRLKVRATRDYDRLLTLQRDLTRLERERDQARATAKDTDTALRDLQHAYADLIHSVHHLQFETVVPGGALPCHGDTPEEHDINTTFIESTGRAHFGRLLSESADVTTLYDPAQDAYLVTTTLTVAQFFLRLRLHTDLTLTTINEHTPTTTADPVRDVLEATHGGPIEVQDAPDGTDLLDTGETP